MSILKSTYEPKDGAAVLTKALALLYRPSETLSGLRQLKPAETKFGAHHAVYELAADTVEAGHGLDQAIRTGSRYLLMVNNEVRAAIEIETDAQGAAASAFKSVNDGPFVQGTEKAIRLAESEPGDDDCDFSLLRISALKLWILWVKPIDASQSARFYVIDPAPGAFDTDRPYTEDALFAVLTPMVQALFKQHLGCGQDADTLAG